MADSSLVFLVFAVSFVVFVQSAVVQTITGNQILTNGNCVYVDGEVRENGVSRKATAEDVAKVNEYQEKMTEWGQLFSQYMTETMSHMFTPNYVAPPAPIAPKVPCLCSPQACSTRN